MTQHRKSAAVEFAMYVSISAGLALAASSFAMLAALFRAADSQTVLCAIPMAGALALVVSWSIGALASRYPSAPGVGAYVGRAFGRRAAIVTVLLYLSLVGCLAGTESFIFAEVMERVLPGSIPGWMGAFGVLSFVLALNFVGLELPLRFQLVTMAVLVISILTLSVAPLWFDAVSPPAHVELPAPPAGVSAVATTIGMATFLYLGFEWVTPMGRTRKHYERLIPLSMPVAIVLLAFIYWAFAASLARNYGSGSIAATVTPQFLLGSIMASRYGPALAVVACMSAMMTALNASLLGGARLVYAMSREGALPAWLSKISLRTSVPTAAVALMGGIALSSSFFITRYRLTIPAASYAAAVECFIYGALMFAAAKVEAEEPKPAFRSPAPRWAQVAIGVAMPLLGVGALFGDRETVKPTIAFFAAMVAAATGFAMLSVPKGERTRRKLESAIGQDGRREPT